MLLGRVIGTVVPCVVYEGLRGVPMLLVQPLDKNQKDSGTPIVCCDSTRMAGPGEFVYYEGGREAAMVLDPTFVPVDHSIVGIVDGLDVAEAWPVFLGIVRGSMYSTIQHRFYQGQRMLMVDLVGPDGQATGKYIVAVDTVDAGIGDQVLILDEGNGARQVLDDPSGPVRSVIVGIIDAVSSYPE